MLCIRCGLKRLSIFTMCAVWSGHSTPCNVLTIAVHATASLLRTWLSNYESNRVVLGITLRRCASRQSSVTRPRRCRRQDQSTDQSTRHVPDNSPQTSSSYTKKTPISIVGGLTTLVNDVKVHIDLSSKNRITTAVTCSRQVTAFMIVSVRRILAI